MELKAYLREKKGKEITKKLLRAGKIPAILYGWGEEPIKLYVEEKELQLQLLLLKGKTPILTLWLQDTPLQCIVKAIQKDPVKNRFIHIDFQKIHPEEEITIKCPIFLRGQAPGVKAGGTLDHHLRDCPIKGKIDSLPPKIEVDISNLKLGHSIHLSEIKIPNVQILLPPDTPVVSILAPKKVEEVKVAPPTPTEPEVIEKKEKETKKEKEKEKEEE